MQMPEGMKEFLDGMVSQHQQQHMTAESRMMAVDDLFDSLSVEQLLSLRWILNCRSPKSSNQYFDGMAHAMLKHKYHVDPSTGQDPFASLTAPQAGDNDSKPDPS